MTESDKAARMIVSGASATAAGFVVRLGARIGFLYAAAHLFGIALFGAYTIAVAAIEIAVTIGGLGAKRILFKRLEAPSERPPAHIILDSAVLVAGVSVLLAGLLMLGVVLIGARLDAPNLALALFWLAPAIVGQALLDLVLAGTRWTQAVRYEIAARSLIEPYAALAAVLGAALLGWRETGLVVSYWVGTGAALLYACYGLRRRLGGLKLRTYRLSAARKRTILRESVPVVLNDLLNGVQGRIDITLVALFMGETGAGIYGMARQIRTPLRQVRQSFDGLLNPIIARTLAQKGAAQTGVATASATRLILAIQLPLFLALVFGGEALLGTFGPGFAAGYLAMLFLAAAETIQGAFGISDLIILYHRPRAQLLLPLSNIAANVGIGLLLIGPYGVTGAGIAVLCGALAGAAVRRAALRNHFAVRIGPFYHAGPVLAAVAAAGVAVPVAGISGLAPGLSATLAATAAVAAYVVAVKLWLRLAGERLAPVHFTTEAPPPAE